MKSLLQSRLVSDYGSVLVLLVLVAYFSLTTVRPQHPVTPAAASEVAAKILRETSGANVLIFVRDTEHDQQFAQALEQAVRDGGGNVLESVAGEARDVRRAMVRIGESGKRLDAVATHRAGAERGPLQPEQLRKLGETHASLAGAKVYLPDSYNWSIFLTPTNLINVINQNVELAIIAIGMTMIIITTGIDLSVGSLVALSGVITAVSIQGLAGGESASLAAIVGCCLLGILACAFSGSVSGFMITRFGVPAFVVTLAWMQIARGMALKSAVMYKSAITGGTAATPEGIIIEARSFGWLGGGDIAGIPTPIVLMLGLFLAAHVVMSRTALGRYIYAVGGNAEAARLSGVPVTGVLLLVYTIGGALAGLAGVVDASRFEAGRPNAGEYYELHVIAAVVVGGTSLAGGEGRVFGTLVGVMIIAVIRNGLNINQVESFNQMIVFGALILGAVVMDQVRRGQVAMPEWLRRLSAAGSKK